MLGLIAMSVGSVNQVKAETISSPSMTETSVNVDVIRPGSPINLNELMNQAFWQNTGSFFGQAAIPGQLNFLFGWKDFPEGSFSDNSLIRDTLLINTIRADYFKQLAEREPTIRTKDIPNPFNTSVQQNPSYVK